MLKMFVCSAITVALLAATPASGQMCGDANGDTTVNITDLIYVIEYLCDNPTDPPINLDNADCDGIWWVTIGDAVALSNYMFHMDNLDCQDSGTYAFYSAPDDTVFFPRMLGVPDGVNQVSLPVVTSFQDSVDGFYLPFLRHGTGSNGVFSYSSVYAEGINILVPRDVSGDTTALLGIDLTRNQFGGSNEFFSIEYNRVGSGTGDIMPELVDRSALWRVCIERNGELWLPVVMYYDVDLPPDTLFVSPTVLQGEVTYLEAFTDTFPVEFTSAPMPVDFDLVPSESWIVIVDPSPSGYQTPASVEVTFNSASLEVGVYTGTIDVVDVDPSVITTVDQIDVSLSVNSLLYPWGDLDCNGQTDVADLMLLIGYLFLGVPPHPPCP